MHRRLSLIGTTLGMMAPGVLSAASITSFTPTYGAAGDPGYISIYGSGFYPGTLDVRFNGVQDPTAVATLADGTLIQARVPAGAPLGPGRIRIRVGSSAWAESLQDFTVIGPGPYVHSFSPTSGSAGALVTLTGAHFAGVTNVTFNGKPVTNPLPPPSDTQMQVNAPAGVTTGPITLRSAKGVFTTSNFYVPPVLAGFLPTTGRAGTNVIITGANLVGTTSVLFGGPGGSYSLPATSFTVLSNGALQVTVPVGAYTGALRVETPAGAATATSNFVVQPLIQGFSPTSGGVNTPVLITGANLNVGTPTIRFNGVTASVAGVSFGQLTAYVPATATTGPLSVQTTHGSYTTPDKFYVPPTITSFTPNTSAPGSRITVTGQNFTDATTVSFNSQPAAAFFVTNNTSLGAVVPAGVTTGPLTVITPGGLATSALLFYAAPIISDFIPTHGVPGTVVTLTGQNFVGATQVQFNGVAAASFTVVNNTTLQATVPAGAQNGPITVVAPGGTAQSASPFLLDYTSDLSVTITADPDPVWITSNLVFTIVAANGGTFAAANTLLTNTLPPTVTFRSAHSSQGTVAHQNGQVIANLGLLNLNSAATVTVTVTPQSAGSLQSQANVASDYPDPQPSNNSASVTTTVMSLPLLSIRQMPPDRVRVAWPLDLASYLPEYNADLSTTNWLSATSPVVSVGNERVMVETNIGKGRFYRLKR
jgi:hypothetical protein